MPNADFTFDTAAAKSRRCISKQDCMPRVDFTFADMAARLRGRNVGAALLARLIQVKSEVDSG